MKYPLLIFCCTALFHFTVVADEPAAPPKADTKKELSPELSKRLLAQKTAELHVLQDEILKLGGDLDHPTRVRVTLRFVEIDMLKLKRLKLSNPFADETLTPNRNRGTKFIGFASDKELLDALEPIVNNGCAKILANPVVTTSLGQSATISCFRELPNEDLPETETSKTGIDNNSTPGFHVEVLPRLTEDGGLLVVAKGRFNAEDPAHAIKLDGRTKMAVSSRSIGTTMQVKPGVPLTTGGLISSSISPVSQSDSRKMHDVIPGFLKVRVDKKPTEKSTAAYMLLTAEMLSGDASADQKPMESGR